MLTATVLKEIEIIQKNNEFIATIKGEDGRSTPYGIHNVVSPAERYPNGTPKNPKGLTIKFDETEGKVKDRSGVISEPSLATRFEYKYEGDDEKNIIELLIEKSNEVTGDKPVQVLKVIGATDYRARIGGRKEPFYFIIQNCHVSIHVEEVNVDGRKLYYLVIHNKSMR